MDHLIGVWTRASGQPASDSDSGPLCGPYRAVPSPDRDPDIWGYLVAAREIVNTYAIPPEEFYVIPRVARTRGFFGFRLRPAALRRLPRRRIQRRGGIERAADRGRGVRSRLGRAAAGELDLGM